MFPPRFEKIEWDEHLNGYWLTLRDRHLSTRWFIPNTTHTNFKGYPILEWTKK